MLNKTVKKRKGKKKKSECGEKRKKGVKRKSELINLKCVEERGKGFKMECKGWEREKKLEKKRRECNSVKRGFCATFFLCGLGSCEEYFVSFLTLNDNFFCLAPRLNIIG